MEDFLQGLPDKQSKKVAWTLRVVRDLEQVPTQYLKKLKNTDDIWKFEQHLEAIRFGYWDFLTKQT